MRICSAPGFERASCHRISFTSLHCLFVCLFVYASVNPTREEQVLRAAVDCRRLSLLVLLSPQAVFFLTFIHSTRLAGRARLARSPASPLLTRGANK